ncbi:hypothetical protein TPE_0638 [Treponema pedis str. T A4]|uniref:Uncharacterized protein n=1 Tax=Treponema pedis str. T A4 TaxID=1291379 RepID=S6A834_9SPIR|nr:hypothetical protein TPE_0638 [Treponema pedis str. T A4]
MKIRENVLHFVYFFLLEANNSFINKRIKKIINYYSILSWNF